MKVSYFQPLKHGAKTRREFNIGNFKGVDLTSPTFDVASNRAIQCQNFLRNADILEKREGLNHIKDFEGSLLNIWVFKNFLVFHVDNDIIITNKNCETLETYSNIVKDVKISSIVKNDKLYIFGGIFLYILTEENGTFTLSKASDAAYIPTTTIGIGAVNLELNYDTNRQTYDEWNLLTPYHKNELTTGYPDVGINQKLEFILDSDASYPESINISGVELYFGKVNRLVIDNVDCFGADGGYVIVQPAVHFHTNIVYATTNNGNVIVDTIYDEDNLSVDEDGIAIGDNIIGYISSEVGKRNKLVLLHNYGNYEQQPNNVEITFASEMQGGQSYIDGCTHAVQYTDAYSQNRVIVTGNEEYKNIDWRSENLNIYALQDDVDYDPNVRIDDLTYFPAENQAVYGFHNKDIVGYGLHADGKLLAFKENSDDEIASVYIREGVQTNQKYNKITDTYTYDYKLNLKASNKGSVPVNFNSITSYKGYVIYLGDDKKINIITNGDKSFATTIYAQPISHQIEKALESYGLDFLKENAFIYTKNDYVYIVVGSSIFALIYEKTSSDDDYSFEYYLLNTNILFEDEIFTALVWCDDHLIVGTSNGALFEMKNSVNGFYNDNRKIWLSNSEFTGNVITEGKIAGVAVGDYLRSDYYFTLPELTAVENESEVLIEGNDYLLSLVDYINRNEIEIFAKDARNIVSEVVVELFEGSIKLSFKIPVILNYGYAKFGSDTNIYVKQSDKWNIRVKDIDGTTVAYGLEFADVIKDVTLSTLGEVEHTGYIEAIHPVNAYYITAPMTMGTLSYYKNIYSYTISNDTNKNSELQLAIISNAIPLEKAKEIGENVSVFSFDLQEIDFAKISLAQDYIPVMAYTKYRNIFRQRFTDFVFYNRTFTNAILSKMTVVYTITSPVVGGD